MKKYIKNMNQKNGMNLLKNVFNGKKKFMKEEKRQKIIEINQIKKLIINRK